jgi:hypothetical protein
MTSEQRAELEVRIVSWRKRAEPVGPLHALWDYIFEAEDLLRGSPTHYGLEEFLTLTEEV